MTGPMAPYGNTVIKYRFNGPFEGGHPSKGVIPGCDYIQMNLGKPVSQVPAEVTGVQNTIFPKGLDCKERKRRSSEDFDIPVPRFSTPRISRTCPASRTPGSPPDIWGICT